MATVEDKMAAEVAKLNAERDLALIEKMSAEERLIMARLRRVEAERLAAVEAAKDERNGIYQFSGQVTESSIRLCQNRLIEWDRLFPDRDIRITLMSGGGEIVHGVALYDFIQTMKRPSRRIVITALGLAASMASVLLQAGDWRVMGREAWLMLHEASLFAEGKTSDVSARLDWVKAVQERMLDIYASRSRMTKAAIRAKWGKDWFIDSKEALAKGFVDEVVG